MKKFLSVVVMALTVGVNAGDVIKLYSGEGALSMRCVIDGELVRFGENVTKAFKDYDAKDGVVLTQGRRFWLIGGEGTVENKRWQTVATIITGEVDAGGKLANLRQLKDFPYAVRGARGIVNDGKAYVLGGRNHSDFMRATILENGEFGDWESLPKYPMSVERGGLVFYKGCFYANGKATWRQGSDKMYALKMKGDGTPARKWKRVDSPDAPAQGFLDVAGDDVLYFDKISGNIYVSNQEQDGLQLAEWKVLGSMPVPAGSSGVVVTPHPGKGWIVGGGYKPYVDGKFDGFNDTFLMSEVFSK